MPAPRRAVRVANCSGAALDPSVHMYNQAKCGDVDVITAVTHIMWKEFNLAKDVEDYQAGKHPGYIPSAWDGLQQTMELASEKRIKIVINGGGLNPKGLAEKTHALVVERGLDLKIAYVEGENLMNRADDILSGIKTGAYSHIDDVNPNVNLPRDTEEFLEDPEAMPIVCANAYLGYRAIKKGLDDGADIVICGRVSDASPVIAAAAWWHQWGEADYDALAGALIAGHLIECSTYVTGANFAGAYTYPMGVLMDLGLPIAEVSASGECVVTKHEALNGIVTADTVRSQLLYEIQGNIFLHSDVKADIAEVQVDQESPDRVYISGVRGYSPPPTTKLAVFYHGGYQCEMLINANGYATDWKYDFQEAQLRSKLAEWNLADKFDVLDFQRAGRPMGDPDSQLASTTYMRIFAQAKDSATLNGLLRAWLYNGMAHFPGMHYSLDFRTAIPKPFHGFYPATIPQSELEESVTILEVRGAPHRILVGPPQKTEPLQPRQNYDTASPIPLDVFGSNTRKPLGDIALGRSGDKGGNVNCGLYVQTAEQWDWLRSFLTRDKLKELMGKDWRDFYFVERVEMPRIYAVHFVVYGALGMGVSSSRLLDSLGKGFVEFIRAVHVPIPTKFLEEL